MARNLEELMIELMIQYCRGNQLEEVKACLTLKVDVNTVSEDGRWSGLTIAAKKNYRELLEIFLSHPDVNINKPTIFIKNEARIHVTALMYACGSGNSAIVSRLVEVSGLDINYQNEEGNTAAILASGWGHTECVRILAETGRVDWNKGDNCGETPLYWALEDGRSYIVDIIVRQPNIDYSIRSENGETLAHAAVRGGDVKCVETLAAQDGCDWNVPDQDGDNPAIVAIKENKKDILNILLTHDRVNFELKDKNGDGLISIAHKTGNLDLVKMIEDRRKREVRELKRKREEVELELRDVKQRYDEFFLNSIREKESELECPVCLETAGGEIFICVEQHLVCSQCRPRVVECPQCRQPYPPTPLRHRYAEKIAVELENLRQNL